MTSTATAAAGHDNDWADITASEASLRRFLHGLPGVDQVGAACHTGEKSCFFTDLAAVPGPLEA